MKNTVEDIETYLKSMLCSRCRGKARYRGKVCVRCGGTGESRKSRKLAKQATCGIYK